MLQSELDLQFKTLLDQYYTAWSRSWDEPLSLYAKDANAVYYDVHPPVGGYTTWNSYLEAAKGFFAKAEFVQITPSDDQQVTRKGDVAWSTGSFHLLAKQKNGTTVELDCRVTLVWEKRHEKWLIHEHLSAPLSGSYT